jgi:tRNA threonylcarbamoyladenosine biosynthesis protein TsaE
MTPRSVTLDLPDLDATRRLGHALGRALFPGAVLALEGGLGAGKTHLVRAIAEGLDVPDPRIVTSPTFVLLQQYEGRLPIHHFDAYRLTSPEAFVALGVDDMLGGDGVCIIEWADLVERVLPADRLRIRLRVTGETSREALLEASGERHAAMLTGLAL